MKIDFHTLIRPFVLSIIITVISSCAHIKPANVVVSKSFNVSNKRIAVLPFANSIIGGYDAHASDVLSAELMKMGFTVVERQQLQAIISELKLSSSDLVSQENIRLIGKILNVETIVFGTVVYSYVPSSGFAYGGIAFSEGARYVPSSVSVRFVNVNTGEVALLGTSPIVRFNIEVTIHNITEKIREKFPGNIRK
jgi:curli biogenesis system outer membrane secretion channel CsgG